MTGLVDLEEGIARLEAASERCIEATREANATAKALRHAAQDAQRIHDRLEEVVASIPDHVQDEVSELIAEVAGDTLEEFGRVASEAVDGLFEQATETFRTLVRIAVGLRVDKGEGDESLLDFIDQALTDSTRAERALVAEKEGIHLDGIG